MNTLKKILGPVASLRITVALLAAAMLLIFAGTLAQRTQGIWDVKSLYFNSWFLLVPFQNLIPFRQLVPFNDGVVPGKFPFVGGKLLIILLLVNLLAAHTVRFKFNWKRSGVLLTHFGLIMLLVGELVTNHFAVESQMPIVQGGVTNWSHDIREAELSVTDPSPADHDDVVCVSDRRLRAGGSIRDVRLPFDVEVVKYYPNSVVPALLPPFLRSQVTEKGDALSTDGELKGAEVVAKATVAGTQSEDLDRPAAFVRLTKDGQVLGTYLVSVDMSTSQKVTVAGKAYDVALRFKRLFKPYTVTLIKFSHDKYDGTDTPRNFSSRIRLVEPAANVDREVLIRMNEPLRYGGETFYQSSFMPGDAGTVLQVVRNPGWMVPYIAVVVGAVGMILHFGMHLAGFLRRRAKEVGGVRTAVVPFGFSPLAIALALLFPGDGPMPAGSAAAPDRGGGKGGRKNAGKSAKADKDGRYTLQPTSGWGSWSTLVPAAVAGLCLLYVFSHALPGSYKSASGIDVDTFARVPVSFDGRPMPLDSVARGTLKILSGRESIKLENGDRVPAVQWLADALANNERSHEYKVFRVDHPQVKALLGLGSGDDDGGADRANGKNETKSDEKMFSISDILSGANPRKLQEQVDRLPPDDKTWDLYQKKVAELHRHIALFMRLAMASDVADLWAVSKDPQQLQQMVTEVQAMKAAGLKPSDLSPEQRQTVNRFGRLEETLGRVMEMEQNVRRKSEDLYFAPPAREGGEWQGLGQSVLALRKNAAVNPAVETWLSLVQDLRDGRVTEFNAKLRTYHQSLAQSPPPGGAKAGFEVFFNRFDPFLISIVFYIGVFAFVVGSWLGWRKPLWRTGLAVLAIAFVIHTFGLIARMYISGRPPVTNLYSSAVFIGWGGVLLCMLLEALYRNGIGAATAALIGFGTLLVAGGLYVQSADTMGQLQAVLDTNFWLATHVVTITYGYAAVFVAGLLAIVYVLGGILTDALTPDVRKTMARMVYGILCFAMILSFVGTILGGIWADQSWGRFWGWDPKENGAILIVLWVAVILHARWGGIVKERGIMLLAIAGNIVTAWSWFGTNMLGVGLHSYGFMEHALWWLGLFVVSQVMLIAIGNFPLTAWRSYAATPPALPPKARRAGPTPAAAV